MNTSSLTCYALLSALETDLRDLIASVCDEGDAEVALGAVLIDRAMQRRSRERRASSSRHLSSLLPYIDFNDAYGSLMRLRDRLHEDTASRLQALRPQWERVIPVRNRVAHSRPLEIDDLAQVVDLIEAALSIPQAAWTQTELTQAKLSSEPGFVLGLKPKLIADEAGTVPHNLPPADFEETGFMGRQALRASLIKALHGPWPVVSILGDGGLGKTALALQVAYDLVAQSATETDDRRKFEAIVWTTAKNATLTTAEITKIDGAIQDSLGLFSGAARELAGSADMPDPEAEVLDYMENFRILLVLDNLETVIDDRIRNFLRALPHGSKVLITSRIGVGTENPFKLAPMTVPEATKLLRTLARHRGVQALLDLHDDEAQALVTKMSCHPGFIKWFVAGVQAGLPPERLVENNGLVLDYCMTNVFEYLGDDPRAVLRSMQVLPGAHTLAELAHLNEFPAWQIQQAVLDLTTTNFLTQGRSGEAGTGYALSDFAKSYLQKRHPVASDERSWLLERHRELYRAGGDLVDQHARAPFSRESIDVRSSGDFHAARCLRSALEASSRGEVDQALALCREASDLAPGYYEAHRIKAHVLEDALDFNEAADEFRQARDVAESNARVRYFYGRFLLASGINLRVGLQELQAAARLDSTSLVLPLAIAEAHVGLGNYLDAVEIASRVAERAGGQSEVSATCLLLAAGAVVAAGKKGGAVKSPSDFAEALEAFVACLAQAPVESIEHDTLDACMYLEFVCADVLRREADTYIARRFEHYRSALRERRRQVEPASLDRNLGFVKRVTAEKGFAFADSEGIRYFVHASELLAPLYFETLAVNDVLTFSYQPSASGGQPRALSVRRV